MEIEDLVNNLKSKKGFIELLTKAAIFTAFLILTNFLRMYLNQISPGLESNSAILNMIRSITGTRPLFVWGITFCILCFLILGKELINIERFPLNIRKSGLLFLAYLTCLGLFALMKHLTYIKNQNLIYLVLPKYLFLVVGLISLVLSIFGSSLIKHIFSKFHAKLIKIFTITTVISTAYTIIYEVLIDEYPIFDRFLWYITVFDTKIIYILLKLTYPNTYLSLPSAFPNYPRIGIGKFIVSIVAACSGIEGFGLFCVLSAIIIYIERKKIIKWKTYLFFSLGALGTLIVNILRIYFLLIVGYYTSPDVAMKIFHVNAGWIFFILYFLAFLYVVYPKIIDNNKNIITNESHNEG